MVFLDSGLDSGIQKMEFLDSGLDSGIYLNFWKWLKNSGDSRK